jgi:hypothetical protein
MDSWESFLVTFKEDSYPQGRPHGINLTAVLIIEVNGYAEFYHHGVQRIVGQ